MGQGVLVELQKFDLDENNKISKAEWDEAFKDEQARRVLIDYGIDLGYLSNLREMLFEKPDTEVSIHRIMELLLSSRRDLPTTFRHFAEGQQFSRWALNTALQEMEERLKKYLAQIVVLQPTSNVLSR